MTAAYEAEGIKVNIKFEPWKRVEIKIILLMILFTFLMAGFAMKNVKESGTFQSLCSKVALY